MAGKDVGLPFLSSGAGKGVEVEGGTRPKGLISLNSSYFSLQSKILDTEARRSVAGYFSLLLGGCPPDFQAVGGPDRPLCCWVYLPFCKMLKISVLQNACILGKVTIGYLAK